MLVIDVVCVAMATPQRNGHISQKNFTSWPSAVSAFIIRDYYLFRYYLSFIFHHHQ